MEALIAVHEKRFKGGGVEGGEVCTDLERQCWDFCPFMQQASLAAFKV